MVPLQTAIGRSRLELIGSLAEVLPGGEVSELGGSDDVRTDENMISTLSYANYLARELFLKAFVVSCHFLNIFSLGMTAYTKLEGLAGSKVSSPPADLKR